jgi:predicted lipoprotein with Yx(FWY)xxD motif
VVPAVLPVMPAGIRLQKSLLGQVFADASGKTLYFLGRNKAKCEADCAKRWIPLPAAALARTMGEWTIVRRADGARQWAYRGKALYTYAGDFTPGQVNGEGGDQQWQAVIQQPELRPQDIGLRETADGPMFVDSTGMTLYALERSGLAGSRRGNAQPGAAVCDAECLKTWQPLRPRAMTPPVGAWSVIKRADGSLQWAYDNKAVYKYAKDVEPGDARGDIVELFVDSRAHSWRVLRPM